MANEIPSSLARIIRAQHGVVTRKQALRAGLTGPAVRTCLRNGSWRQLYRGVYLTYSGPPSRESHMWAAVLYCGRGAVLSHQTAAELHGLNVKPNENIHVTIPGDRRVAGAPGLSIHLSGRPLDPPDAHRDPPHTPICDTLLDLADAATDLDTVCGWITEAFEKEKLHEIQLRFALSQRTRARWRAQLTDLLDCAAAGDHSVLEFRYTRDVERAHGLPESVRQVPFTKADGREGRRDRVYRDFAVIVELDGRLWHPPEAISADKRRDRAAAAVGMVSLRYEWTDVNSRACEAAAEIAQVLRTRGWTGTPRPCFPGCPAPSIASAASVTSHCGLRRRLFAQRSAAGWKRPPSLLRTRSLRALVRQIGRNGEMSGTGPAALGRAREAGAVGSGMRLRAGCGGVGCAVVRRVRCGRAHDPGAAVRPEPWGGVGGGAAELGRPCGRGGGGAAGWRWRGAAETAARAAAGGGWRRAAGGSGYQRARGDGST